MAALAAALIACACAAAPKGDAPVEPPPGPAPLRGVNFDHTGSFEAAMDAAMVARSLDRLAVLGVDAVALTPSFFQRSLDDPTFFWKRPRAAIDGELRRAIRLAHARGLRVLVKPHLWLEDRAGGAWRGFIAPAGTDWTSWRVAYRDVLLHYADLAAEEGAMALALGSELSALARDRPEFWRALAGDVRARFPGSITYAANWHAEVEEIAWWDAVDWIGVDAFWPLVDDPAEELTEARAVARLQEICARLAAVGRRFERPVVLTEIGVKSAVGAAHRPWEWHDPSRQAVDLDLQARFYRALARVFPLAGDAPVRGLFLWKWHADLDWGGRGNSDFTPRGKPAEAVLEAWFGGAAPARAGVRE